MFSFKYGLWEKYNALPEKDSEAIYFITDRQQIYKGKDLIAAVDVLFFNKVPTTDDLKEGQLGVSTVEGKTTLYTVSSGKVTTAGGGEATSVADGAVKFESLDPEALATEIGELGGENKLVTSEVVKNYVDNVKESITNQITEETKGAITSVSQSRSEDNKGTILTFTTKDPSDSDIKVTIKDLFLTKAEYDTNSHKLKLFIQEEETPVEVDLQELIPQAVTTNDVAISSKITVTTNVGNYHQGDVIDVTDGLTLQKFLADMLSQDIQPTVSKNPTATLALTPNGAQEVGTQVTPKFTITYTDGQFKGDEGNSNKITNAGCTPGTWSVTDNKEGSKTGSMDGTTAIDSFDTFTVADGENYKLSLSSLAYEASTVSPKTFLGSTSNVKIAAGSINLTCNSTITSYRNCYYGYKPNGSELSNIANLDSIEIKKLTANKNLPTSIVTNNCSQLIFAIPATQEKKPSIKSVEPPAVVDLTGNYTTKIGGVSDYSPVDYDVYYVNFAKAAEGAVTYNITWGNK